MSARAPLLLSMLPSTICPIPKYAVSKCHGEHAQVVSTVLMDMCWWGAGALCRLQTVKTSCHAMACTNALLEFLEGKVH